MPSLRTALPLLLILTCLFSCKKDDDIQQEGSCNFLGSSYLVESSNGNKYGRSTHIIPDTDGQIKEANALYIYVGYDMNQKETTNSADQNRYVFTYDASGFLKKMVNIKRFTDKSSTSSTYENHGPYRSISIETVQTTDFTYASDKLASCSITSVKTLQGDQDAPFITTQENKKVYQYDANGLLAATTETSDNGDRIETKFRDGIRSSTAVIPKSGNSNTTTYNEKGLTNLVSLPSGQIRFTYDQAGNPVRVESVANGKITYTQQYEYDNHVNPETLIQTRFKGIPEPISTVQSSDGVNNIVRSTTTNFLANVTSKETVIYTYNARGLPEKSVWTGESDPNYKMVTTFTYSGCL